MSARHRIDQLGGNPNPVATLAYRAFQHIAHAQFAADPLYVDRLALVGEARIASDHEQPADAGKRSDDLLDDAVGEIFLLRVAAHILKRQYRDRWLVRKRESGSLGRLPLPPQHAIDPHRPGDILEALLADIVEGEVQLAGGILLSSGR